MIRIGKNSLTLTGLIVFGVCVGASMPTAAQAPCTKWDVFGAWDAVQSNSPGRNARFFEMRPTGGDQFQGKAMHAPVTSNQWRDGQVDGSVSGSAIRFTVFWDANSVGVYTGTIDGNGRIEGSTYDRNAPQNRATWYSERRMNCLARAETPGPAKPPAGTGFKKPTTTPSSTPAPTGDLKKQATALVPSTTCKSGFVWRVARADDLVCVAPESRARVAQENRTATSRVQPGGGAYGPNTCKSGFVWREAFSGDLVCVTPEVRALVREENRVGPSRRVSQ
jgi:hypothetical protein